MKKLERMSLVGAWLVILYVVTGWISDLIAYGRIDIYGGALDIGLLLIAVPMVVGSEKRYKLLYAVYAVAIVIAVAVIDTLWDMVI